MKTTFKLVNSMGVVTLPPPYEATPVVNVLSVMYLPNIGDPEDPEDVDEIEITLQLKE